MQRRLCLVNQHQLVRVETRNLAHDLAADGTRGASYQHTLTLDMRGDLAHVYLDGLTFQQILYSDFADLVVQVNVLPPLVQRGDIHHLDAQRQHPVKKVRLANLLHLRRGDDDALHSLALQHF